MCFYKSKWLNEYNLNKHKSYLRYVDDILTAFDKEQVSLNFLNFLNEKHPNIKFTVEKQVNHSISFLDVFISGIDNENLTLKTYHKATYTELLLNFKSFTSFSYKISLIKVGLSPFKKICVIFLIERPLNVMKNAFYFILKALFVLKTFKFLSQIFGHVGKTA